jgi:hypothetical protein
MAHGRHRTGVMPGEPATSSLRGAMSGPDILSDVWAVLKEHAGTAAADRELVQLRQKWGGTRLYLRKPADCPEIRADRERPKRGPCDP